MAGQVVVGSFHTSFLIPTLSHHHAHPSASRVMHLDSPGQKAAGTMIIMATHWAPSWGQAPGWVLCLIADPYFGHIRSSLYSFYRWGPQTSVCSRTLLGSSRCRIRSQGGLLHSPALLAMPLPLFIGIRILPLTRTWERLTGRDRSWWLKTVPFSFWMILLDNKSVLLFSFWYQIRLD